MTDIIAAVLAAAARASESDRGTLLWRIDGRECRLTAPDTIVITGGDRPALVHQVEGVDWLACLL